jgi:hypothetical protein
MVGAVVVRGDRRDGWFKQSISSEALDGWREIDERYGYNRLRYRLQQGMLKFEMEGEEELKSEDRQLEHERLLQTTSRWPLMRFRREKPDGWFSSNYLSNNGNQYGRSHCNPGWASAHDRMLNFSNNKSAAYIGRCGSRSPAMTIEI